MGILSLVVYGSRARNDHELDSDTDLFAITDDESYRMIVSGSTNIACHPRETALERARSGELFFFHIVREGVAIYDPNHEFDNLRREFSPKKSYQKEIVNASELGYALLENSDEIRNYTLLNKRISWCVRSILIARTAESGIPAFSKKDLVAYSGVSEVAELINIKDSREINKRAYKAFLDFLVRFGCERPQNMPKDFEGLVGYFDDKKNEMGVKTAAGFLHDIVGDNYVVV